MFKDNAAFMAISPPVDIFNQPYTRETFQWWRELSEAERKLPRPSIEGVEKLLLEFKRTQNRA